MTIEDQIRDETLQHDINREAAKISALSSGKTDKYDALESLKPSDKELTPIKDFIPEENLNSEIINDIKRIEEEEKKVNRNKMVYKATNKTYDFRKFKTIRAFGSEIRNNAVDMDTANVEQMNLTMHIKDFANKTKPRDPELKELKKEVFDSALALLHGRDIVYKAFQSGIFSKSKESQQEGEGLKILTPDQMLKRLPIALAQIEAVNNSESLLNEIRQIVYFLYRSKKIIKKYTTT